MTQIIDVEQGTDAWKQARLGRVTASRVADVVAKTKTGWGASRANYMADLIAERLTGVAAERFQNAAMQWGTDTEAEARAAYSFRVDADVVEVGFMPHPVIPMTGASPDGLVGDDGLLELKCPNTATHLEILLGGPIATKYITQMMWQMACTDRKWCDFVSYDPRLPEAMRLFLHRVERDDNMVKYLENEVSLFLGEIDAKVADLTARYGERAAA